jgi:hypothetical protein
MFTKNDGIYYFWKKFNDIISIILTCISVIAGIILACLENYLLVYGLLLIFLGPLFILLQWAILKLLFSFLQDIKYIRNKLYLNDNESKNGGENVNTTVETPYDVDQVAKFEQLKSLLDAGVITREEYDQQKKKILQ